MAAKADESQPSIAVNSEESAAEWVDPKSLKPWADNPRKNDGQPVARVIESIKRFGFGAPIVARRANREIIAGHTRWKASLEMKLAQVPARFLDISEREARLLALADNRIPELTEWSETLGTILSGYDLVEVEMAGWSKEDLEKMAGEISDDNDLPDDVPIDQSLAIVVTCTSESEQTELLDEFSRRGLQCRALL
jgi:ParB-like chromosome segregation protein Spo0J